MALRHKVDRSILAELVKRASGRDSIINLGDRRLGLGVVEDGRNLMVRFRDAAQKTGVHEIDLSDLQSKPLLARAVADALAAWGVEARAATRQALCKDLAIFWRFLDDYGESGPATGVQGVGNITTTVVNAYVGWLNDQQSTSGKGWSDHTKGQTFGSLRITLDTWRRLPQYRAQLSPDLFIRFQLWPGRKRKIRPREILSNDVLRHIIQACLGEITATVEDLERGASILSDESVALPVNARHQSAFREFKVALASLGKRYTGPLPTIEQMKRDNELLGKAVDQYHTRRRCEEHLCLTPLVVSKNSIALKAE